MSISSLSGSRGPAGNKIPKGYSAGKLQQYTPEQMSLYQSLFPYVSPGSSLAQQASGSEAGFAPHEDYARRQFQEFSGDLASRFSGGALGFGGGGPGAMSARRGSGFQNQATQGAQDFASRLAMQRQGLQRQALNDLMGISNSLLNQRPEENFLVKKELPFWQQFALGAAQGGGQGLASGLSGGLSGLFGQRNQSGFQPVNY